MNNTKNLVNKLVKIMSSIDRVAKTGRNNHQSYDYVTEATVLETVRQELIKNDVFVFTSVESSHIENYSKTDKPLLITTTTLKHTFVDADSGEQFEVKSVGQGFDGTDKGVYKSITGAVKYLWMKNLLLPSGDDPEKEEVSSTSQSTVSKPTVQRSFNKPTSTTQSSSEVTTPTPPTTEVKTNKPMFTKRSITPTN